MKKIVILLLTFLEICKGFAQNPPGNNTSKNITTVIQANQKASHDSLPIKEPAFVKLYPNPAKNKAELEVNGFEPGLIQLQIINASGKIVRDYSRLLFSGNENMVVMFSLTPGIYFIVLKQNEKSVKKKMVVQ